MFRSWSLLVAGRLLLPVPTSTYREVFCVVFPKEITHHAHAPKARGKLLESPATSDGVRAIPTQCDGENSSRACARTFFVSVLRFCRRSKIVFMGSCSVSGFIIPPSSGCRSTRFWCAHHSFTFQTNQEFSTGLISRFLVLPGETMYGTNPDYRSEKRNQR